MMACSSFMRIDGSIIGCGQTYQQIAIGLGGKGAQNLRELGGAEFAAHPAQAAKLVNLTGVFIVILLAPIKGGLSRCLRWRHRALLFVCPCR